MPGCLWNVLLGCLWGEAVQNAACNYPSHSAVARGMSDTLPESKLFEYILSKADLVRPIGILHELMPLSTDSKIGEMLEILTVSTDQ